MARTPDSLRIRREIEAREIPPVWLWTGPEAFLKEELFTQLLSSFPNGELGRERFRSGQEDCYPTLGSLRTMPMLAERRVVFWQDIQLLKKGERDALVEYVRKPSPETVLVLTSSRGPRDSLNLRLEKAGALAAVFWIPFANQTLRWIQQKFKDRGLACSSQVANHLLAACAGVSEDQVPLQDVAPELEKVALAAVGGRDVTLDHLRVVSRKPGDDCLRKVTRAVGEGDISRALRALDQALLFKENAPVRIVATLALYLRGVAHAQDLLVQGVRASQVPQMVGIWPKEWEAVKRCAQRYSPGEPRRLLSELSRADRRLKSSSTDSRFLLETVLASLCEPQAC